MEINIKGSVGADSIAVIIADGPNGWNVRIDRAPVLPAKATWTEMRIPFSTVERNDLSKLVDYVYREILEGDEDVR